MTSNGKYEIKKGDRVEIEFRGSVYAGKVLSSDWDGPVKRPGGNGTPGQGGWYLEVMKDVGGYGYWKQGWDGGEVVSVNGVPVDQLRIRCEQCGRELDEGGEGLCGACEDLNERMPSGNWW